MRNWFPWRRRAADQALTPPDAAEPPAEAAELPAEPAEAADPGAATRPDPNPDTTDDDDWDLESLPEDPDGSSEIFVITRPGAHPRGRRA